MTSRESRAGRERRSRTSDRCPIADHAAPVFRRSTGVARPIGCRRRCADPCPSVWRSIVCHLRPCPYLRFPTQPRADTPDPFEEHLSESKTRYARWQRLRKFTDRNCIWLKSTGTIFIKEADKWCRVVRNGLATLLSYPQTCGPRMTSGKPTKPQSRANGAPHAARKRSSPPPGDRSVRMHSPAVTRRT
jgi:hypothetical protein